MKRFYGTKLPNPLMLGTAQYPSPAILEQAFRDSGAGVATVSLRRESGAGQTFWQMIRDLGVLVLAVAAVAAYINDDVKQKTADKMRSWFGEDSGQ